MNSNFNFESTLVVMPARSNSKRIPNKNIKNICGQPMIYWPLMELKKIFNEINIMVLTDSLNIKNLVDIHGINHEYIRPSKLADDCTGTDEVVKHAL